MNVIVHLGHLPLNPGILPRSLQLPYALLFGKHYLVCLLLRCQLGLQFFIQMLQWNMYKVNER